MLHSNDMTLTLIFGSQDTTLDQAALRTFRDALLGDEGSAWVLRALLDLPKDWSDFAKQQPSLEAESSLSQLKSLTEWLTTGGNLDDNVPGINVLATTLSVALQLLQYQDFVRRQCPKLLRSDLLATQIKLQVEIAGLCTGLVTASAVAKSSSLAELEINGSEALKQAMIIGGIVDNNNEQAWHSVAVKWSTPTTDRVIADLSSEYNAYISVQTDPQHATVTLPSTQVDNFVSTARSNGYSAVDFGLRGAFHSHTHNSTMRTALVQTTVQTSSSSRTAFPIWHARGSGYLTGHELLTHVVDSILTDQADWQELFSSIDSRLEGRQSTVVYFGSRRAMPQRLVKNYASHLVVASDLSSVHLPIIPAEEGVAVIGMACNVPGGDGLDEFWNTIRAGISQHTEVPPSRMDFRTMWRTADSRKWFGNFLRDPDAFDHKFFKKSGVEVSSMDPQQRLIMQAAYQALEQAGYFNNERDLTTSCFIGIGTEDYETNVACHQPTAYTATGNLRSFAAGKISHQFGWSGPSLTIDTACSSSAVALHYACKAILAGDTEAALAGGTNVMTGPEWFQNLAGASFLSTTGQCKPFDEKADGYCRGEGAAAVYLKRLSAARRDGNQILGVIKASFVNQNENCSAITAPSTRSLSDVFRSVVRQAGLRPEQISVVEAHGTGTQVGDKAEYEGIRQVFGSGGTDSVELGSVKGLIGHLESASGIAAVIKTLLMIQYKTIPPQASHDTFNPKLKSHATDSVNISKSCKPWSAKYKAALVNNYGASGSNASLIVAQPPVVSDAPTTASQRSKAIKSPFWLCGVDDRALQAYCTALLKHLVGKTGDPRYTLENISFQVSQQSNRTLSRALYFSSTSVNDLTERLSSLAEGTVAEVSRSRSSAGGRPVILCFGGQTGRSIGLDQDLFDSAGLLRKHLDDCDAICQSKRLESIYPVIFQKAAITSVVRLQVALFAIQYATARAWIDCGLRITAVVGHSFGELTAACISGLLSLEDSLELVARRANLIESQWAADGGSMLLVDATLAIVQQILASSNTAATIACYNGPRSFTIAGSTTEIDQLQEHIEAQHSSTKVKRLPVTHAFHSALVDPLLADLSKACEGLIIRKPVLHFERATREATPAAITADFAASHMRNPVYFDHAVQRLAKRFQGAVWLEAGHGSGITTMAARALGSSQSSFFQAINLGNADALADACVNLWSEGLSVSYWPHHLQNATQYQPLVLPSYQFEKHRHWLNRTIPVQARADTAHSIPSLSRPLWTFTGWKDATESKAEFDINTMHPEYTKHLSAHTIAKAAAICPTAFQQSLASRAITSLVDRPDLSAEIFNMESQVPLVHDPARRLWLDVEQVGSERSTWKWSLLSANTDGGSSTTRHAVGNVSVTGNASDARIHEFAKYERLSDRDRCQQLLSSGDADQVIRGTRNIYKAFEKYAHYSSDEYKRLETVASRGNETAARVMVQNPAHTNVGLADTFCQVAGIYLNCLYNTDDEQMFLCTKIDNWIRSPRTSADASGPWEVYAKHHKVSEKTHVADLFVFDASTGQLAWVIVGLHFAQVSYAGIARLLTSSLPEQQTAQVRPALQSRVPSILPVKAEPSQQATATKSVPVKQKPAGSEAEVRGLLCNLLGLEVQDVKLDSDLLALGVDSLLAMELAREVQRKFNVVLEIHDLMALTDFKSLRDIIDGKLGNAVIDAPEDEQPIVPPQQNDILTNGNVDTGNRRELTNGFHDQQTSVLSGKIVADAFAASSDLTDRFIEDNDLAGFCNGPLGQQNEMIVVHIVDAFEELGVSLRTAAAGSVLGAVDYDAKHEQIVSVLRRLLVEAGLVQLNKASDMVRTSKPVESRSAAELHHELVTTSPEHKCDHDLTYMVGCRLADCLTNRADVIQLLFGSPEGRELVSNSYARSPIHITLIKQLSYFWETFAEKLDDHAQTINILELGAGTGGTTSTILPVLAAAGIPVTYTITDLSPGLVAGLRKRFGKQYPFVKFEALNMEQSIPEKLLHTQHAVLATNCVHATRDLSHTLSNIRDLLRDDGFLIMLEMTEVLPWVDLVFGLCEGWWLFNDGRKHACIKPEEWKQVLLANGFARVDWTQGEAPESKIQQLILAQVDDNLVAMTPMPKLVDPTADQLARQELVDSYVTNYVRGFTLPDVKPSLKSPSRHCVLVTGATGSLGCHLVAWLATQTSIDKVICLNRLHGGLDATARQIQALESWQLLVDDSKARSKLVVLETDSSKPFLGLQDAVYDDLSRTVTGIIHSAWPMSFTRPLKGFAPQLATMRGLMDLAAACTRQQPSQFVFQLISSIAVVGHYPYVSGHGLVPEVAMTAQSAMPMGYAEAKLVCESMLSSTLGSRPALFRTMSIRLGQIAGSSITGLWNSMEHIAQLCKSSQSLRLIPDLPGDLSWCPVDKLAATVGELHTNQAANYTIYHIENPVRQPWQEVISTLAEGLNISKNGIVPFDEWLQRVSQAAANGVSASENPAARLGQFWREDFIRMSCGLSAGGLVLDTQRTKQRSKTLSNLGALDMALVRLYVQRWKDVGFLDA